jgi:hypothetical protein
MDNTGTNTSPKISRSLAKVFLEKGRIGKGKTGFFLVESDGNISNFVEQSIEAALCSMDVVIAFMKSFHAENFRIQFLRLAKKVFEVFATSSCFTSLSGIPNLVVSSMRIQAVVRSFQSILTRYRCMPTSILALTWTPMHPGRRQVSIPYRQGGSRLLGTFFPLERSIFRW